MREFPEDAVLVNDTQAALLGTILDRDLSPEQAEAVAALIYFTYQSALKEAAEEIRKNIVSDYHDIIAEGYNAGGRDAADLVDPEVKTNEA